MRTPAPGNWPRNSHQGRRTRAFERVRRPRTDWPQRFAGAGSDTKRNASPDRAAFFRVVIDWSVASALARQLRHQAALGAVLARRDGLGLGGSGFFGAAFLRPCAARACRASSFFGFTGTSSAIDVELEPLVAVSLVSTVTRTVPPFLSLPNRISSASGFLMCSWMTRPAAARPCARRSPCRPARRWPPASGRR